MSVDRDPFQVIKAHLARRLHHVGRHLVAEARDRLSTHGGPSAPGQSPHQQSGELARSVDFEVVEDLGSLWLYVGTSEEHGAYQELGTGSVEPRPWLLPTIDENEAAIVKGLAR